MQQGDNLRAESVCIYKRDPAHVWPSRYSAAAIFYLFFLSACCMWGLLIFLLPKTPVPRRALCLQMRDAPWWQQPAVLCALSMGSLWLTFGDTERMDVKNTHAIRQQTHKNAAFLGEKMIKVKYFYVFVKSVLCTFINWPNAWAYKHTFNNITK